MLLHSFKVKNSEQLIRFMKFVGILGILLVQIAQASDPLVIEKIDCENNSKTSCEFIIEKSGLKIGDEVHDDQMQEVKMRLELLGYFDETDIRLSKGSSLNQVLLTFYVKEHSSLQANFTGGVLGVVSPGGLAEATVMDRNLTGSGDSLEFQGRWSGANFNAYGKDVKTTSYRFRIEYNRNLGNSKYFFKSGLNYGNAFLTQDVQQSHESAGWVDLAFGRKIFDHSFLVLGTRQYLAHSNGPWNGWSYTGPYIQYGWDSQDDPNFPTRGSKFLISVDYLPFAYPDVNTIVYSVGFRQHWEVAPSHILSLNIGRITQNKDITYPLMDQPALSLRYTKQFKRHASSSDIQNGAFYIEPGVFYTNTSLISSNYKERYGAKIGTTLQTSLGILNFFFLGTN